MLIWALGWNNKSTLKYKNLFPTVDLLSYSRCMDELSRRSWEKFCSIRFLFHAEDVNVFKLVWCLEMVRYNNILSSWCHLASEWIGFAFDKPFSHFLVLHFASSSSCPSLWSALKVFWHFCTLSNLWFTGGSLFRLCRYRGLCEFDALLGYFLWV